MDFNYCQFFFFFNKNVIIYSIIFRNKISRHGIPPNFLVAHFTWDISLCYEIKNNREIQKILKAKNFEFIKI